MKKIDIFVFSATGNTYKCAEELKNNLVSLGADAEIKRIENGLEKVESWGRAPDHTIRTCRSASRDRDMATPTSARETPPLPARRILP